MGDARAETERAGPLRFEAQARFPVPAEALWAYHARPGAFERLAPPWERVEVLSRAGTIEDGVVEFLVPAPPGLRRWRARMTDAIPGRRFVDVCERGPVRAWRHEHWIDPEGPAASRLRDVIAYDLPVPPFGRWLGARAMDRRLRRLFRFRHARTADDLARQALLPARPPLRVGVSGAGGFLGSALGALLSTGGHEVVPLVRDARPGVRYDPARGEAELDGIATLDALVHLAGEPVVGRWTPRKREAILASRVGATRALASTAAAARRRGGGPRVLLVASGVGLYGDRGAEELTEESGRGRGFLAEVASATEAAARKASEAGVRTVFLRFGVVLGAAGGALARLRRIFALGLGGPLGDGSGFVPWIGLDDAIGAVLHALATPALDGPLLVVSPEPATWRDLATSLGQALARPAFLRAPGALLRLRYGAMADEVLLASQRAVPARLLASGYRWLRPRLGDALAFELGAG